MNTIGSLPPSIGIIGGVGPWVDPLILRRLLEAQTDLGISGDQNTIPVLLGEFGRAIGDRTAYLDSLKTPILRENPAIPAVAIARVLIANGARVLGVPCITFHSAPVFNRFKELLPAIDIVDMIDATVNEVCSRHYRIGILTTIGTHDAATFSARIEAKGCELISLLPKQREAVHSVIYEIVKNGIGAASGYPMARSVLNDAVCELKACGAEAVIMGCTEIPLVLERTDLLIDPLASLATELVRRYLA